MPGQTTTHLFDRHVARARGRFHAKKPRTQHVYSPFIASRIGKQLSHAAASRESPTTAARPSIVAGVAAAAPPLPCIKQPSRGPHKHHHHTHSSSSSMDVGLLNRSAGLCSTTAACADGSPSGGGVSPGAKLQVCALYCAIIADIFVTSYTDTIKTTDQLTITLLLSLQIFLLLAIILAFFLITTSASPHVKLGLYNRYLRQHRAVFVLCGAALLLIGAVAAYRMSLAYAGLSYMQLWGQSGYLALWAVQRVSLLLLQCAAVHATAGAFGGASGDDTLSAAAIDLMAAVRRL